LKNKDIEIKKGEIYFVEELGFGKKGIVLMLIAEVIIYILIVSSRFIEPFRYITIPVSFIGVSLILLIFLLSTSLLFFIKLKTTVESGGIRYRMKPFERKGHLVEVKNIEKYYIKRKSHGKDKKRYKTGLYLELKNGKKLFIETKKHKDLIKAVNRLMER
jgi:biopolymer transport protein ExbD